MKHSEYIIFWVEMASGGAATFRNHDSYKRLLSQEPQHQGLLYKEPSHCWLTGAAALVPMALMTDFLPL